ncbi:uncharacterized protein ISCGN_028437 [Ixodes scapularis]
MSITETTSWASAGGWRCWADWRCNASGTIRSTMKASEAPEARYNSTTRDDVVVFSRTNVERVEHLRIVLEGMRNAGLTIHPGKVQLAAPKINLLGFVVDNGTLRPNEEKFRALSECPSEPSSSVFSCKCWRKLARCGRKPAAQQH